MPDMPIVPAHLSDSARAVWVELTEQGVRPAPGFDAYCNQISIERDAAARIAREGIIVSDPKGQPVPHPALDIQRKAQAEVRSWAGKFRTVRL